MNRLKFHAEPVLILLVGGVLIACFWSRVNEDSALQASTAAGYRDPSVVGVTWATAVFRGCLTNGAIVYDVAATDDHDQPASIAVCCSAVWGCEVMN